MIDEQVKILKFMSEMTTRTDTNEFARKVDLAPAQLMQQMQELAKQGYLKKVGAGFAITDKGKKAITSLAQVPEDLKFQFYLELGKPTNLHARSVAEFYDDVLKVEALSLEFHLYRGDFENWFRTSVGDSPFADELSKVKKKNLMCEDLRKALAKALEQRYSL